MPSIENELRPMADNKPVIIRSIIFAAFYNLTGFFYGTLSLFICWLPLRLRHRIIISWTSLSVYLCRVICGINYRVIGREHLPNAEHPAVILSKHQSTWETLFLQAAFWPACTVLKKELLRIPFFGWGLAMLQPIPIDRSNPRTAIKQIKKGGINRLSKGYNVIIFPEGTRVKPGQKNKYARGGADIAIAAQVPVIPVALNSGLFWPTDTTQKTPGTITVIIGPPISSEGKTSRALTEEVEAWIESNMKAMSPMDSM